MANWTVDQVGDWLRTNGLEKYIKTFNDQDIDGAALIGLQDDDIVKLLEDGTTRNPPMRIQRKFRTILEEYKTMVTEERKKNRKSSSSTVLSISTVHTTNEIETYSKTYTIEPRRITLKFFQSELICSNLMKYFRKKYHVKCHIPMQDPYDTKTPLCIKLFGVKENVKNVQKDLRYLFETIETKIFNDENTDKRVIKWSKHIYSDSALIILQKIFADKNKFTIWEKTNLLSGYYRVYYLTGQHKFSVSEEFLTQILHNEISYVKDIVIPNLENISMKFRKELNEFLNEKKEQQRQFQTMAIIYCQYPSQTEMKISFFGLKNQVDIAKKQIKMLIHKHQMKTIRINLDSKQREYLLDNYVHQLKNIELDYQHDNVKIQIRENIIHTPHYLIIKIKQLIQSMICYITILTFQYLPHAFIITEKDYLQFQVLARNYHCEINQINIETNKEFLLLPKGKIAPTSKYLIQESNQFYSSLSIPRILPVANNTIEIHKSYDLTVDLTIISTTADAVKEQIDPTQGNRYFESDTGEKVLFIQWSLPRSQKNDHQIKESIRKFVSVSFEQIDRICTDTVKTIALSTTDWEKYDNRKQLIQGILHEIKVQLEIKQFSHRFWRILFLFDDEQNDFFNEFSQVILALQTKTDDYEQFVYPLTTTSIILKTLENGNISKCENAIKNYMHKHILTTIRLNHPFNLEIWNQYMINGFYKYCLEKFILPKIDRINKENSHIQCLDLIGSISVVNEAKEKYELMSEIARQRILDQSNEESNNTSDSYNIFLSCCSDDKILSRQLATRLIDEGYLISIDYSDKPSSNIISKMTKADVILICFSLNYSENSDCMTTLMSINRSGKIVVPILFTKTLLTQEDNWLQRIATEELFYESFRQQIKFKLKEDLDLNYDKLIVELLQYTKPGVTGRTYSISTPTLNEEEQQEDNLDQQDILSRFTPEQIQEKEQIYNQYIQRIFEKNKISEDELTDLIESLKIVLENCADENQESEGSTQYFNEEVEEEQDHPNENGEEETADVSEYLNDFLSTIRRWLEKATNGLVIKGNLPPFTLTGDYNDAVFPMFLTNKPPWWVASADLDDFNHSTPELHLRYPRLMIGSWCNYEEAHQYFQKFIDKDMIFRELKQKQRSEMSEQKKRSKISKQKKRSKLSKQKKRSKISKQKQTDTETTTNNTLHYPHFKTNIKKGTIAWDITQDREVLREYERRQSETRSRKVHRYSEGWNRLMDRSVELISDIKEGKIRKDSDELQGKIGKELKTKEDIRKRNQLDDPNNVIWRSKRVFAWRREFIAMKIKNTLEWQEFCTVQANQKMINIKNISF